jgi:prephenate dehydrogenase
MTRVSLLGYGRFGAALAELLREGGHGVRALDPRAEVPAELGASSIQELVEGAEIILVAVPVPALREAFVALRPHLEPSQIVADVGSVKLAPARAMAEVFGAEQPWVATHPLFGPASLARGERPLLVVVVPNPRHPEAVRRVAALYTGIGCRVVSEDAETHDRVMAYTQALAFFVSKGMLDAGVPLDAAYAPPSFQAMARTIETVRVDAGHLLWSLHRDNPFAAEARRRLLDALGALDQGLEHAATVTPALTIPEAAGSPQLAETRELIDEIDGAILDLLARRAGLARRAAHAKAELGRGVRDPQREAQLLDDRRRRADELGLDGAAVAEIFQAILRFSRRLQEPA